MFRRTVPDAIFWAIHAVVAVACAAVPLWACVSALNATAAAVDLPRWAALLATTTVVSGVAMTLAVTCGVGIGALLFRTNLPGRRLAVVGLLVAICIPTFPQPS